MKKALLFAAVLLGILLILFTCINYFFKKYNKNTGDALKPEECIPESTKICLIVPTISKDFNKFTANFKFYKQYLNFIDKVVFIGNEDVEKLVKNNTPLLEMELNFINEKELINTNKLKSLIAEIDPNAKSRSGWYIQQFLKMQYCKICEDDYYLVWDSDTIPLKKIEMLSAQGKPFFDVKTEYHEPYFITMKKLFPDLGKKYDFSFISEHMLIKTNLMNELIDQIHNLNIPGDTWYEKVINCIDPAHLKHCGFSEFETYGTFVQTYHPEIYEIRKWNSLRNGKNYYDFKKLSEADINQLAQEYDAISFENWG